jgi:hypothetical protein
MFFFLNILNFRSKLLNLTNLNSNFNYLLIFFHNIISQISILIE